MRKSFGAGTIITIVFLAHTADHLTVSDGLIMYKSSGKRCTISATPAI